jgi:hypothetical protein
MSIQTKTDIQNFVNRIILVKPGYPGTRVSRALIHNTPRVNKNVKCKRIVVVHGHIVKNNDTE